jgi:hypothetical protein
MKTNILREIFSGANGKLSAKRVIGGIAMAVALACTTVLVFRDGSNNVVENLLMTIFITSVSLLGLPAITGIWGNSKIQTNSNSNETVETVETVETKPVEEPTPTHPYDPCSNCPHNKKETI